MKKPINLKDLPTYLDSLRQNKNYDENLVVDMGNITIEQPNSNVNRKFVFSLATLLLFLMVGGIATYNFTSEKTVILDISSNNEDIQTISNILLNNGASLVSIKQKENSIFEVKINKSKDLSGFLDKLRKNKEFKKVELK